MNRARLGGGHLGIQGELSPKKHPAPSAQDGAGWDRVGQGPPWLLVTHTKVSGYIWHMRWMTSICSSVLLTASLFWVSQGVYADQNWGPWGQGLAPEAPGPTPHVHMDI